MIRTPATDKKWFDDVMVELRLRQVHGSAIGDTVASARELLADTGQSAEDAFGPAREYAASLELPHAPIGQWVRAALWPMLASLLAFLLFAQAATAWAEGELLLVSPAQVALVGTPVVLAAFMPLYLTAAIRRPWILIILVVVCSLSGFLAGVVAPETPAEAWLALDPVPWLIGSSVIMVLISVVVTLDPRRSAADDRITDPSSTAPAGGGRTRSIAVTVTNWLFPVLAVVMLGVVFALTAAAR